MRNERDDLTKENQAVQLQSEAIMYSQLGATEYMTGEKELARASPYRTTSTLLVTGKIFLPKRSGKPF